MKYVNFLFHIYQPPVQDAKTLAKIVEESYAPLTRRIREFSDLKFTLNINFSLVELLNESFPEIIENIREAYERGNLELTATGAYHPIFPLIPLEEVRSQVKLNNQGNRRLLSKKFKPEGIFPPELAFSGHLVSVFRELGYRWTIADDGNLQYYGSSVPYNKVYSLDGFPVLLRSNLWANKFANYTEKWQRGADFVDELLESMDSWMGEEDGYLIIALDGETFGHHHPELNEGFLIELFEALRAASRRLETNKLAGICRRFPSEPQFIPPGSWSTDSADIENRDYFAWWKSRRNRVQQLQWQFMNYVLEKVRKIIDPDINDQMNRALYSCQFWWASYWKFNVAEIYKGAFNMMEILQRAAEILKSNGQHLAESQHLPEGEAIFRELVTQIEIEAEQRRRSMGI